MFLVFFSFYSPSSRFFADAYFKLYQNAGWPQQGAFECRQQHSCAIKTPYRSYLSALVDSSIKVLLLSHVKRGQRALRQHLDSPTPALVF